MNKVYQVYQISDSTGETLDRIFLAIKAQFSNFNCKTIHYSFTRTKNQIDNIISKSKTKENIIILYTIVDNNLAKHLASETKKNNIPCFEVLGNLISSFSRLLKQEANRKPSGQHTLDKDYYNRIEAVQFTISHDDGKIISDLEDSDVILVGVSRTSKTPTSIYLANRGYKVANIPFILNKDIPAQLIESSKKTCVVGFVCDAARLSDVRRNRIHSIHKERPSDYTNEKKILNKKKIKKNNLIVAIPSSGVHSNGYSLVRHIIDKKKINLKKTMFLKKELLKPTKIYVKEVLSLIKNNLINGCANITGGGLSDNIKRVIPDGLTANINLNKIKVKKIFSWLKENNVKDKEMLKTFNCGVGFCLIIDPKNLDKVKKFFTKDYKPYVIGKIILGKNKIKLNEKINWS